MIDAYLKHEAARATKGIPALPLNAEQTAELCELLQNPMLKAETWQHLQPLRVSTPSR